MDTKTNKPEPIRQGHKYLCPTCKKSYFTKDEAKACIEKHEVADTSPNNN